MTQAEISRLEEADFTASLRQGTCARGRGRGQDPRRLLEAAAAKLDRQGLLAALKNGVDIDGVALATPTLQLSVRTK